MNSKKEALLVKLRGGRRRERGVEKQHHPEAPKGERMERSTSQKDGREGDSTPKGKRGKNNTQKNDG